MRDKLQDIGNLQDSGLGVRVAQRVAAHQKSRLQVQLLRAITQIPAGRCLVLRGAVALNRVHFNGRWSEDIDFLAPDWIAGRFSQIAAEYGLCFVEVPNSLPCYRGAGSAGVTASISVDVISRPLRTVPGQNGIFSSLTGEQVEVRVQPAAQILADKITCVTQRLKAADFVDLWEGLRRELVPRDLIWSFHCRRPDAQPLQLDQILSNLDHLQVCWQDSLAPLMPAVPQFHDVRRDLCLWLPVFAGLNCSRRSQKAD